MTILRDLLTYNYAEHRQLWAIISALDESAFVQQSGYSLGSIQREVVHMIRADSLWFARATGEPDPELMPYETTDREVIRAVWDDLERRVLAYAGEADDAALHETVTYTNAAGNAVERRRWELLAHLANHGTVHRAEMCAMLHIIGHTVDFEVSLRRYLEESG